MLKIETKKLQKALTKAIRGCTFGTMPISSMMGIKVEDNTLFLTATDQLNYIQVTVSLSNKNKDFDVAVPAEKFNKLIQKMTSENIVMALKTNYLEVTPGGKSKSKYKIELPLEGESFIKSPQLPIIEKKQITEQGQIELKTFKAIFKATSMSVPKDNNSELSGYHHGGYYCGEKVITFDGTKASVYNEKLFDEPYLFCKEAAGLIECMDSDIILYRRDNDAILLTSDNVSVYTLELENKQAYPEEVILGYFEDLSEEGFCKLPKQELNQALDRVTIFVTEKDNKPVKFVFDEKSITLSNKKDSGAEEIDYIEVKDYKSHEAIVNFEHLKPIISNQGGDVSMYFGAENNLKFVCDKTKYVISLILDGTVNEFEEEEVEVEEETGTSDDMIDDSEIPF